MVGPAVQVALAYTAEQMGPEVDLVVYEVAGYSPAAVVVHAAFVSNAA